MNDDLKISIIVNVLLAIFFILVVIVWGNRIEELETRLFCGKGYEYNPLYENESMYPTASSCCLTTTNEEFNKNTGDFEKVENKSCEIRHNRYLD